MKHRISLLFLVFCLLPLAGEAMNAVNVVVYGKNGKRSFHLECASTEAEKERGLMYRDRISPNSGMYFAYTPAQEVYMWMHETRIPLDMLFVDARHRIVHTVHALPYDETPVGTPLPVVAVMELPGGTIDALRLAIGQRVAFTEPGKMP